MGLKALKENIEYISFTIKDDDWFLLKKDNEFKSNLVMPCCNERAIMKNSSLGFPYFSHYRKRSCTHTGESIEHLMLKKEIYEILIKQNYKVEIEKNLQFDDYLIRPDVYLELDGYKIAFEIQVSNQSLDTVNERTKKYKDKDIIVVWLNLFTNRTYNYTYFNKNNTNAKMYEVNYYNDYVFKYDGNSIESLILNGINETFEESIKIEDQIENFISISGSNYYINNHYKVNDKYRIFTKDDDYFIERKEEDRIEPIEIFFIKGFVTNSEVVNVNINKKLISEKKSLDPVIGEVKKPIKVKDIEDTIIDAAHSLGWEVTKNYLYKIDLLLSKEHYKVAIIKNIDGIYSIDECRERKIELVLLDSRKSISFLKKDIQAYAFNELSNFIIDFDGKKYSAYTFFINKLTQTQEGYPFDKISQIELSNYLTPTRGDNYRFDQALLDKEPNLILDQINIVNKGSKINAYYLSGFMKYDMKLVL